MASGVAATAPSRAYAQDCPTARSAPNGFVIERDQRSKTEVFVASDGIARTILRHDGQTRLETTQFEGRRPATATIEFAVKKADTLYIGPCKYAVLRLERREARGGAPLSASTTDYYAPDLKRIIAKEHRDTGDRTTLIKYDRIYSIKR
jgi:hypothetical protein